jgi:VanZ family protein
MWAAIVFILYAIPGRHLQVKSPLFFEGFDKLVHFGMFAVLAVLAQLSAHKLGWFRILACIAYGALLEGMQSTWFSERTSDWFDFMANNIGIAFGSLAALWLLARQRKLAK